MVAGGFATVLLRRHDVNYYLEVRPPELFAAGLVIGVTAVATAVVLLFLVVRWRWVVQVILFQRKGVNQAFTESVTLTSGLRWKLLVVLMGVVFVSIATGALASLLGSLGASLVLGTFAKGVTSLAFSFGVLLMLRTTIGAIL